jgi:hypothetical protein
MFSRRNLLEGGNTGKFDRQSGAAISFSVSDLVAEGIRNVLRESKKPGGGTN